MRLPQHARWIRGAAAPWFSRHTWPGWLLLCWGAAAHAWLLASRPPFTDFLLTCLLGYGAMLVPILVQRLHGDIAANLHRGPRNWCHRTLRIAAVQRLGFKLTGALACVGLMLAAAAPLAIAQSQAYAGLAAQAWVFALLLALGLALLTLLDAFDRHPWDTYYRIGRWLWQRRPLPAMARTQLLFSLIRGFFLLYCLWLLQLHHGLALQAPAASGFEHFLRMTDGIKISIGLGAFVLVSRILGNHPRSVDASPLSWLATLACYPPLGLWLAGIATLAPLDTAPMASPALQALHGLLTTAWMLVYCSDILAWGDRFSQLSYRGLVRHGPFAYLRHPAYASKCALVALGVAPGLSSQQWLAPCGFVLLTWGLYWLRARGERIHLMRYPEYRALSRQPTFKEYLRP